MHLKDLKKIKVLVYSYCVDNSLAPNSFPQVFWWCVTGGSGRGLWDGDIVLLRRPGRGEESLRSGGQLCGQICRSTRSLVMIYPTLMSDPHEFLPEHKRCFARSAEITHCCFPCSSNVCVTHALYCSISSRVTWYLCVRNRLKCDSCAQNLFLHCSSHISFSLLHIQMLAMRHTKQWHLTTLICDWSWFEYTQCKWDLSVFLKGKFKVWALFLPVVSLQTWFITHGYFYDSFMSFLTASISFNFILQ